MPIGPEVAVHGAPENAALLTGRYGLLPVSQRAAVVGSGHSDIGTSAGHRACAAAAQQQMSRMVTQICSSTAISCDLLLLESQ